MKSNSLRTLTVMGALLTLVGAGLALARTGSDTRKTNPERAVADLVDSVIQPRFQVTNGKDFGVSRIAPRIASHGHLGTLRPENEQEKKALEAIASSGFEYKVGFVHTGFSLSRYSAKPIPNQKLPSFERIWHDSADYKDSNPAVREGAGTVVLATTDRLTKGEAVEAMSGDWHVFARPVRAEKDTCVSCHTGVQKGQVMGAVVYLVRAAEKPGVRG